MDRAVLGDVISHGIKNLGNILARRKYVDPQFQGWQKANDVSDDEFLEEQQAIQEANEISDNDHLDTTSSSLCNGN